MKERVQTGFAAFSYFLIIHFGETTPERTSECRVSVRTDALGYVAFCNAFTSSATSFKLPHSTTKLQIFQVKDLPLGRPLAPNLAMLVELEVLQADLSSVSCQMFAGLHNLTAISLERNNLRKLPADAFKHNLLLSRIDLSSNFLLSFGAITESLKNLKSLTSLNLSKNKLIRWISEEETAALKNLPLQELDISLCSVETITAEAFRNFPNLSSLSISMNVLGEEGMRNLSESLNFKTLRKFSGREMKSMSYFSSQFLRRLRESNIEFLDLSGNRFTHFPSGNHSNLKELILNDCELKQFLENDFVGMPNLEILILSRNEIERIGKQFYKNTNLKTLDLSKNIRFNPTQNITIENYAFKHLVNLENLHLNEIPIHGKLRRFILYGLSNLLTLNLYRCNLLRIEDYAFETLNKLVRLDLSYNVITELSNKSFYGLRNVESITLSNNALSFIKSIDPFAYTPQLKLLNLKSNKILQFPNGIFSKLYALEMIQVDDNAIRPWSQKLLPEHPNMTIFLFSKNAIAHFTKEMFQDMSSLEFVDFSENPLNCSECSTLDLQNWMNRTNATIVGLSEDSHRYKCHHPPSASGVSVQGADLSHLQTSCIPREVDAVKVAYSAVVSIVLLILMVTVMWFRWKWNIKYCLFSLQLKMKRYKEEALADRYTYDAFVSYCETDLPWVIHELMPTVEGDGSVVLCLPDRDFNAGNILFESIAAAIEKSRTTILILSNQYIESNWGMFEVQMVQNKLFEDTRSGLILVFLEPIHKSKVTKNLQYVIKTRTCIQWTLNPIGQKLFWERLKLAIKKPKDKGIATHIT